MSSTSEPIDLQFDRAEFTERAAAAPTCGLCQQQIEATYFDVNGQTICAGCRASIARAHSGHAGLLGVIRAIAAGLAAGVVGALLYYAVLALTGYEIGLIAVAVGFMVGRAVHWGSGGRGGASYQAIAVAITYIAIVSTYVPFILSPVPEAQTTDAAAATATTTAPAPAASQPESAVSSADGVADAPPPTAGQVAFFVAILAALILAAPFLAGFQNIIGWLIIGFALYEAWKINRRVRIEIAGPFTLGASPARPADAS